MPKKNTELRRRILEQFAQFVQVYVTTEVADAVQRGEITPEEILAKVNLEIMRTVKREISGSTS